MDIDQMLEVYSSLVRQHHPAKAQDMLRGFGVAEDVIARIVEAHRKHCQPFIDMTDPTVLRGHEDIETWYEGPDFPSAWCWPAYKELLARKGFDPDSIDSIDRSSTRIMAHLPHPDSLSIRTRGLVVGYVQSGKTASFTALSSKAVDIGYKLVIVLAGMTSSLRQQTQKRLTKELIAPNVRNWVTLTDPDLDFRRGARNPAAELNPRNRDVRILAVVKKNTYILGRLRDYFRDAGAGVLETCPTLIIDDEADQASINTRKKAQDRSAINKRILEILSVLPKAAYVAYTATPFANVFIDPSIPEDLYPRDFIFSLPRPPAYFGAERVFGRGTTRLEDEDAESPNDGLDMLRTVIDPDEIKALQPPTRDGRFDFEPSMTSSLEDATLYFLLATACRYARGQQEHSSMLVHTTYFVHTHGQLRTLIEAFTERVKPQLLRRSGHWYETARRLWKAEMHRVEPAELELLPDYKSFEELETYIPLVCERLAVTVDNGSLGEGLQYPDIGEGHAPRVVIAVGGNTLSRGLTLEGLVVSYFIRQASAYDTLLQMGRWFGYRVGYEDLPRAWMPESLQWDFYHLATVEEELRLDISRYENEKLSPEQFAVRIRTHSRLLPTSKMKMQNVILTNVSFSDSRQQTTFFKHDDKDWLVSNLDAGRALLSACRELPDQPAGASEGGGADLTWYDIPSAAVLEFLSQYQFSEKHVELSGSHLEDYIRAENEVGGLLRWNVSIVSRSVSRGQVVKDWYTDEEVDLGTVDLGLGARVRCINRSRFQSTIPANIKALTSSADRIRDLPVQTEGNGRQTALNDEAMVELRNEVLPDTGLLLLYPISKDSVPLRGPKDKDPTRRKRHPLNAEEHVLGVALVFPRARTSADHYMQNNLKVLGELYEGEGEYGGFDDSDSDLLLARPEETEG